MTCSDCLHREAKDDFVWCKLKRQAMEPEDLCGEWIGKDLYGRICVAQKEKVIAHDRTKDNDPA